MAERDAAQSRLDDITHERDKLLSGAKMRSRLTDEEVWLRCYCAGLSSAENCDYAIDMADMGIKNFRKRFPAETAPAEQELVVEWVWVEDEMHFTATHGVYALTVWCAPNLLHYWNFVNSKDNDGIDDGVAKNCQLAKAAAVEALRKELGK
jgi:hypothetical protein